MNTTKTAVPFTGYEKFVIFILAVTQFSVILDFMVMSPLGDFMMKSLSLTPAQFGLSVSAYAFSAGIAGLLTAGFADSFDRKKLLLFFYVGFVVGTFFCGIANSYQFLLIARIITGLFGGVIGSISMAIITDLFEINHRGMVMGFVQMGFGASQVLGIPIGLYLANAWNWHLPFIMIAVLGAIVAIMILIKMQPVTKHLLLQHDKNALTHLWHTLTNRRYAIGFLATALLSIGGFMMMPFGAAFAINNLKITSHQLPFLYMVSGVTALIIMPVIGKLSDKIDKFKLFAFATGVTAIVIFFYSHLSETPLWEAMIFNILIMSAIMSRMVPAGALVTGIPDMRARGAFMSINSSLQQIAGGIAAAIGGMIVVQKTKFSPLEHYTTIGYITIVIAILNTLVLYRVNKLINQDKKTEQPAILAVS